MDGATKPIDFDQNLHECRFHNISEYERFQGDLQLFLCFLKKQEALQGVTVIWEIWGCSTFSFSVEDLEELGQESLDKLQDLSALHKINLTLIDIYNWKREYNEVCTRRNGRWSINPVNLSRLRKLARKARMEKEKRATRRKARAIERKVGARRSPRL